LHAALILDDRQSHELLGIRELQRHLQVPAVLPDARRAGMAPTIGNSFLRINAISSISEACTASY
jgi:hypothetical protein